MNDLNAFHKTSRNICNNKIKKFYGMRYVGTNNLEPVLCFKACCIQMLAVKLLAYNALTIGSCIFPTPRITASVIVQH